MPQCNGVTGRGEQCRNNAVNGTTRCRIRHSRYLDSPRCTGVLFDETQCLRQAEDDQTTCRRCRHRMEFMQRMIENARRQLEEVIEQQPEVQQHAVPELAAFAQDRQNVHTRVVVKNTLKAIEILLNLNPEVTRYPSKKLYTELIVECPVSVRALCDFTIRYWSTDVTIYDMEPGIYFKIANTVWDFTKKSPHKEDICKIIATELDDSVGMCAQGALSRLCNILAGYVEGIGEQRSVAEILGNAIASIARDSTLDLYKKLDQARAILNEHSVPKEEWGAWLDALAEEGEEDYLMAWKMSYNL